MDDITKTLDLTPEKMLELAEKYPKGSRERNILKDQAIKASFPDIAKEIPDSVSQIAKPESGESVLSKILTQSERMPKGFNVPRAGEEVGESVLTKITPEIAEKFPKLAASEGVERISKSGLKKLLGSIAGLGVGLIAEGADAPPLGERSDEIPGRPVTKDPSQMTSDDVRRELERKALDRLAERGIGRPDFSNIGIEDDESQATDPSEFTPESKRGNELMMEARRLRSEEAPDQAIRERIREALNKYRKSNRLRGLIDG